MNDLKLRLERLLEHCEDDYKSKLFETLDEHLKEFNSILQEFHKINKFNSVNSINFEPDNDEEFYGGISDEGKGKFRKLISSITI